MTFSNCGWRCHTCRTVPRLALALRPLELTKEETQSKRRAGTDADDETAKHRDCAIADELNPRETVVRYSELHAHSTLCSRTVQNLEHEGET
jgi:hypothetical protein